MLLFSLDCDGNTQSAQAVVILHKNKFIRLCSLQTSESKVRFRAVINIAIPYSILFRRCHLYQCKQYLHHIVKCLQENLRRSVRLVILSWCYETLPILHLFFLAQVIFLKSHPAGRNSIRRSFSPGRNVCILSYYEQ